MRARSHFWNEWVPNAELLDMCLAMPDMAQQDTGWQEPQNVARGGEAIPDPMSLADGFAMPAIDPALGNAHAPYDMTDPGDLLAAYMLESAQANVGM